VSLSPLSAVGPTVKPLSARSRGSAWLLPILADPCRSLPILAEPDADPFAVLRRSIEQRPVDVARVGPPARHIEQPIAAVLIAAELDADSPIERKWAEAAGFLMVSSEYLLDPSRDSVVRICTRQSIWEVNSLLTASPNRLASKILCN
jgi:hypothetical protein